MAPKAKAKGKWVPPWMEKKEDAKKPVPKKKAPAKASPKAKKKC